AALEPLYGLYRPNRLASGLVDAANAVADRMDARSLGLPRRPDANPDDAPDWVPARTFAEALAATDWRWGTAVAERGVRLLVLHELVSRALAAHAGGIGRPGAEPSVLRAMLTTEVVTQSASGRMPFNRPARFDTARMGPDVDCPTIESVPRPGRPGPPRPFG